MGTLTKVLLLLRWMLVVTFGAIRLRDVHTCLGADPAARKPNVRPVSDSVRSGAPTGVGWGGSPLGGLRAVERFGGGSRAHLSRAVRTSPPLPATPPSSATAGCSGFSEHLQRNPG